MTFDAAWQDVKCEDCGAEYQCTPSNDYFHRPEQFNPDTRTLENGVCNTCLLTAAGIQPHKVINVDENNNVISREGYEHLAEKNIPNERNTDS